MSGLFGKRSNSVQNEIYTGIQVSTSMYGGVIPYVAGRQRVKFNLLWYGGFASHQSNSGGGKGGGGQSTSTYTYTTSYVAALCLGPIQNVFQIWHDKALETLASEGLTLFLGSSGQAAWGGYPSGTPAVQQIPYDHIAYVAAPNYNLGSSASMPNLTFEVEGVVPGWSDAHSMFDADLAAVLTDYLTDSVHGAGFGGTIATLTGTTNTWQAYYMSLGLITSPYEDTQRGALDFVKELMQITNSDVVLSAGTLKVIPYGDQPVGATTPDGTVWSWTPALTPIYSFTDSDFIAKPGEPPVLLTRKPLCDTHNIVNVEYLDRSNYYNAAPVGASDLNDVALNGPRVMNTLTLHQITNSQTAKMVAQLVLQADLYDRNTYEFSVRADYSLLEPMDVVAITDATLGLAAQVVRILEIEDDEHDQIKIKALEIPGVTRSTPQYNWAAAQGYFANYGVSPGNVAAPFIFQMPPLPSLPNGLSVGIAVCGTAGAPWLGAYVYMSADGGSTYSLVGTVKTPALYGTLSANLPAGAADPDVTNTLSITLANTALQLNTGITHADADNLLTPVLIGTGTPEVLSYGAATLVSAGNYNLTYLRRGRYGTASQLNSSGAPFAKLDGNVFVMTFDPGMSGQTIYFKFCSFNTFTQGTQSLGSVAAYAYTLPSASSVTGDSHLVVRGQCALDGTHVYKASTAAAAWDSDCYCPQGYTNGCFISWRAAPGSVGGNLMAGFSTNPTASVSYTSLDFAIYQNAGTVDVYESGTLVFTGGSYAVGDAFEVRYDGVTVRYFQNGTLLFARRAVGLTVYPKICIDTPSTVASNVAFGAASALNASYGSYLNNLPWIVGTSPLAAQGNFASINAGAAGGGIFLAGTGSVPLGPNGVTEPIWYGVGNGTGGNDPGWSNTGDLQGIDPLKTYRSSVWFRYHVTTTVSGDVYHGCDTSGATADLSGAVDSNPYFLASPLSAFTADKWYLSVGFIHGSGYGTVAAGIGGVYDPVSGAQVLANTEFKQVAGKTFQTHRCFEYDTTTSGVDIMFARPRFEEVNGTEPTIWGLLHPTPTVDPSSGLVLALGSVPQMVPTVGFSWTTTSGQVTLSWPAFTLYRSDGTSTAIAAGSGYTVTGLTNGTVYTLYPYVVEGTTTVTFATGAAGAVGSPAVCYPGGSGPAAQVMNLFGNVPLVSFTVTPSGGGGGGGGNRLGCLHPQTSVELAGGRRAAACQLRAGMELVGPAGAARLTRIARRPCAEWVRVTFRDGGAATVTGDHRFVRPDGTLARAAELRLDDLIAGRGGRNVAVEALSVFRDRAELVSIELEPPHTYFLAGALSHNPKP